MARLSLLLCALALVATAQGRRGRPQPGAETLACGSDIAWRTDVDGALADAQRDSRPVFWYVPTLAGSRMDRKPVVDLFMMCGPFSSPEVANLVSRRFIPVKARADRKLSKRFAIKPPDFVEPGFLVLAPDGEVLLRIDRISTFHNGWISRHLHGVLGSHPKLAADSAEVVAARRSGSAGGLAAALCDEGFHRDALLALGPPTGSESREDRYTRARAVGHTEGTKAGRGHLTPLHAQNDAVGQQALTETGRLHLRDGSLEAAATTLAKAAGMKGPRRNEAAFFHGIALHLGGEKDGAGKAWRKLAKRQPADRWTRKANAELERFGPFVRGFERFRDLPVDAFVAKPDGTQRPRTAEDLPLLVSSSFRFLREFQGDDGRWSDSNYDFGGQDSLPNVYAAVSALAATAILEWRDTAPEEADRAVAAAFDYLRNDKTIAWDDKDEILWAHAYRLIFFERLARSQHPKAKAAKKVASTMSRHISDSQLDNGSWRHEYPNPFATATALHALSIARSGGIRVGKDPFKRGGDALLSCRGEEGTFSYGMPRRRRRGGGGGGSVEGSAGRMPLCELALLLCDKSDQKRLTQAIESGFAEHHRLEKVRKIDDHADRYANGGFFFWYDMYGRTMAIEALKDTAKRDGFRVQQRDLILAIPEIDATFQESHETGRVYATAMALICLKALKGGKP